MKSTMTFKDHGTNVRHSWRSIRFKCTQMKIIIHKHIVFPNFDFICFSYKSEAIFRIHYIYKNIDVCKTLMPPFPNIWRIGLTLTFDLLTWISIEIIYSSRTIYLPSLKLLGQSVPGLSVAQGLGDWHDLWPWPTDLNINRDHLLIKDYLPTKFDGSGGKAFLSYMYLLHKVWETDMTFDLYLWPTDLNIDRDHLLIKVYLPTKFEAFGTKRSWVISCTRLRDTDIPTDRYTDRQTYRPACATQYAPPSSKGAYNKREIHRRTPPKWTLICHTTNPQNP